MSAQQSKYPTPLKIFVDRQLYGESCFAAAIGGFLELFHMEMTAGENPFIAIGSAALFSVLGLAWFWAVGAVLPILWICSIFDPKNSERIVANLALTALGLYFLVDREIIVMSTIEDLIKNKLWVQFGCIAVIGSWFLSVRDSKRKQSED